MITLTPRPGVEVLTLEVPEDAEAFRIEGNWLSFMALYQPKVRIRQNIKIAPGQYSFIATTRDITESQAAELVISQVVNKNILYLDYTAVDEAGNSVDKAIDSFFSAIRAAGGDPDTYNYAILLTT